MTHFDAAARPMLNCFSKNPVFTNYQAEKPRIPLDDRNPKTPQRPPVPRAWISARRI